MSDDSRISPYNLADCKNTTDDALQNYLNSLPEVRQSHFYTDVKLALGYTAVIISAACFAFDYKLGFDATKNWTTIAVVVYFALNAAFTYWIWAVEKGLVFTGDWKGRNLTISSRVNKFDPTYILTIKYSKAVNSAEMEQLELDASFTQWFTADGFFVAKPFQQWLASSITLIGEIDPKNVVEGGAKGAVKSQTLPSDGVAGVLTGLAQEAVKAQSKLSKRKA